MFELLDQPAKTLIVKRRRLLRLPYTAHKILIAGLDALTSKPASRAWLLPPTSVQDEVDHYSLRHKLFDAKGPRPKLRTCLTPENAEEIALKIDAALQFTELGENADPLIKPILLYYACAHLCGVYTRAFLDWERDSRKHGLSCHYKPGNVQGTQVTVEDLGQFNRLAVTCFLLTGRPSCFSPVVTYFAKPTAQTGTGELLESFVRNELGHPISGLTLEELTKFDYGSRLKPVRSHHGFHKFKGLAGTAFLLDVITLFMGSSMARYDVIGWRQVLDGKNNSYRIHFEECFDRFLAFGVDALLSALEDPIADFDKRLVPSQPSPYSHDDSRFKGDPNCQT